MGRQDSNPHHVKLRSTRFSRIKLSTHDNSQAVSYLAVEFRQWDLNPRPASYEPAELPLLHTGLICCKAVTLDAAGMFTLGAISTFNRFVASSQSSQGNYG